ncbi:MAG TPA: hypothetical protein VGJ22_04585 [Anaerolineales bacterium]|jgi:hypothetical protein
MKMRNVFAAASAGLALMLLAACSGQESTPMPAQAAAPATGIQYHFVTNKLMIPTTREQAQAFALNVDGVSQEHPKNIFGELFALLTSAAQGVELQATLDQAVDTGQVVSLHMVKADDPLNDTSVSWSIYLGQKSESAPKFDGSDIFTLDTATPTNSPIVGSLTNGHFSGGPGAARVQMFIMGQLVDVGLIGVRLEADLSAQGCADGKLGGGVTVDEFNGKLLPAIAAGINQVTKTDAAAANAILQAFDTDEDGTITIQELEDNTLLMIAISPDLDLLDASGAFNPGQDGEKDSYSVGMGFTCVPASFDAPGD